MKFRSDAALVRHYFKELLEDGREHGVSEIVDYIHKTHGTIGVNGDTVGSQRVYNAIYHFLRPGNNGYGRSRWGNFIKQNPALEEQVGKESAILVGEELTREDGMVFSLEKLLEPICDNALRVLWAAEIGVRNCFMSCYSVMESTDEVEPALRGAERDVFDLLAQAACVIKEFKDNRLNGYSHDRNIEMDGGEAAI